MKLLALLQELLDDQRQILKIFALGAVLFFVGLSFIIYADKTVTPSVQQEAIALLGTLIAGSGFITAMSAQILLIISRLR
jgi:hypothetical protein